MTWLVTGGAGYIGAHVVRAFLADGIDVVVVDDLSSGKAEFVPDGVPFVQANLLDTEAVRGALEGVSGVVHLAGFKYAGVSVERPLHTYTQNVTAMVSLLEAMDDNGRAEPRVLVQRGRLRDAEGRDGDRVRPRRRRSRRTGRRS